MADVQKSVEIVFGAVDNLSGALQGIGGGIKSFADNAQEAISPLNNIADAIKTVDTALVAVGLAFGGLALQKAGEFGDSVKQIGVLFEGTKTQVAGFEDQILEYAANSTKGLGDITGALNDAIGSGVEWTKSLEFLTQAENLALGASGSLNDATNVLISSLNAYGESTDAAGKYTDTLMQTVLLGKTTLPELAGSLANVTSTAAAAKVPFEEIGAAVAALTAAGLPTAQAVTAVNQAIVQMISPSKQAADTAKELKLEFGATALATDGLSGTLKKVYDATGGNVEQMALLFGSVDALKAALALGADNAGVFAEALNVMTTTSGSAARAAETLREQWSVSVDGMTKAVDLFMISVGKRLNADGEFGDLLKSIQGLFTTLTFQVNDGAFDQVFATMGELSTKLSEYLKTIAANLPAALEQIDWSKFDSAIRNLAESLGGMFDMVDLSTPEGLADALQLVIDVIANLINQGAGIAQAWGDILEEAMPLIEAFAQMGEEAATSSGKVLGMADVLDKLLPIIGSFGGALEAVGLAMNVVAAKSAVDLLLKLDALALKIPGAAAAATLLGTALGTGGLVAAAGAAGYAVGTVLNDGIDWVVQKLTGSNSLGGLIYDLTHDTEELANAAPAAGDGLKEIGDAVQYTAPKFEELTTSTGNLVKSSEELTAAEKELYAPMIKNAEAAGFVTAKNEFLAASQAALKKPTDETRNAMNEAADALDKMGQLTGKTAEASATIRLEFEKLSKETAKAPEPIKNSAMALAELATSANLSTKDLLTLTKTLKDAEVKLEEIASNERIKKIEAQVKLDIAEVEANAKIATAILDNLSKTYEADAGLIGELTSQITNGYSTADKFRMKLIEEANERINEMHKAQLEQIGAYVEYMQAKTAAINSGSPVLTVNADGLQPHLEGIMWEIFKQIQIKLAQEGGDLIVGGLT